MASQDVDLAVLSRGDPGHQIPLPGRNWRTRVALPGLILVLFGGLLAYTGRDLLLPARSVRIVPVVVKRAAETSGGVIFQAAGWVEPDPFPVYVSALAGGTVEKVLVLEGQSVSRGQLLVQLVSKDAELVLASAKATVLRRTAELNTVVAQVKAAERRWNHPVDRKLAVSTATNQVRQAESKLTELAKQVAVQQARLEELSERLKRQETAFRGQGVPEWTLVKIRLEVKTEQAMLAAIEAKGPTLQATVAEHQSVLAAARENLRLRIPETRALEESKSALAQAKAVLTAAGVAREQAQLTLDRMKIVAPVDGVVLTYIRPGAKLMLHGDHAKSALAVQLYNPTKLQVRVDVPLAEAARVSVGQRAQIVVEVLPDKTFTGVVTRIVHAADIQKNTLQVKVAIEAPSAQLKPEMLARVKFLAPPSKKGSTRERLFVPEKLVVKQGRDAGHVWIVDKGRGRAVRRPVSLGPTRLNSWIEVTSGLNPGDALIGGDRSGLTPELRVRIVGEEGGEHAAD